MDRFIIDESTNTLVECRHHMYGERLDYLIIPHSYNGKQIDAIGPYCFKHLVIGLLCIEDGVKYLSDSAFENACVLNIKLPRGLKIGERCFANSELQEILLPRDLHTIKSQTFLNCRQLEAVYAQFGVNTISYGAFAGCENLKEAHFRIVKNVRDYAFEGCKKLETIDFGCQLKQLGRGLFDGCASLSFLKLEGSFDKLEPETFAGAQGLYSLELQTSADSLYIPPDCFCDTNLREISLLGNFEPIVEKRCCFPDNILLRGYNHSTPLTTLGYYFDFEAI